uniref:Uncharacterized protein n=1 Tax=viral metagenome TaxID=1070528 RepID=A0A6M3IYS1_9ZZZZ
MTRNEVEKRLEKIIKGSLNHSMLVNNVLEFLEFNQFPFDELNEDLQRLKKKDFDSHITDPEQTKGESSSKFLYWINETNKRIDQLEGRINDYQVVIDSFFDGNLGKLKDIIVAAVKDQYIDVQKQVNDQKMKIDRLDDKINDYQVVIDSLFDGNLGKLKDVIETAVKDQYIDIQKQVNDQKRTYLNIKAGVADVLDDCLKDSRTSIFQLIAKFIDERLFESTNDLQKRIDTIPNWTGVIGAIEKIFDELITVWGASHLNSAHRTGNRERGTIS